MYAFAYLTAKINSKINKINDLLSIRKIVKNWLEVALFRVGYKKDLTIKFRDGKSAYFKSKKEYFEFWKLDDCSFKLSKEILKLWIECINGLMSKERMW